MKLFLVSSFGLLFVAFMKVADAISATTVTDVNVLVQSLLALNGGVIIQDATLTGGEGCAGLFTGGAVIPGMPESGVILSSGTVENIAGPNDQDGITTSFGTPGDTDLDSLIPGYVTNDACVLQLQFQCPAGTSGSLDLTFNYVFGSDEYNEWVGSDFNDVMGLFLNGQNIALLPDGLSTPVAINNVNNGLNIDWYNDNSFEVGAPYDIEADGFTTTLTANAATVVGLNTIKLAVADAGDTVLDSWILLQAGSFSCTSGNCMEYKGCHPSNEEKRAICHHTKKVANTLCLPPEAVAAHLANHPNDYCGCCSEGEEKKLPLFCDGTGSGKKTKLRTKKSGNQAPRKGKKPGQ